MAVAVVPTTVARPRVATRLGEFHSGATDFFIIPYHSVSSSLSLSLTATIPSSASHPPTYSAADLLPTVDREVTRMAPRTVDPRADSAAPRADTVAPRVAMVVVAPPPPRMVEVVVDRMVA